MMVHKVKTFDVHGGQNQVDIRPLSAKLSQSLHSTRKTRSKLKTAFACRQRKLFNDDMDIKKRCISKGPSYNAQ